MIAAAQILEPRGVRIWRWAWAAAVVATVHLGSVAFWLVNWREEEPGDSAAGAVIIEMTTSPAAAPVDAPDVARGPLMEEAKVTPLAAADHREELEEQTAPIDPSPALEPDVVLSKSERQPDEDKSEEKLADTRSAAELTATPLTTAPPRVEPKEMTVPAPPSLGTSALSAKARATWEKALIFHLSGYKRYPNAARSRSAQGKVSVTFTVDRTGSVIAVRLVRSSGSAALDEEALNLLQRASPLPAPPDQVAGNTFDLTLPLQFRMR